jgi:hypothetical protein
LSSSTEVPAEISEEILTKHVPNVVILTSDPDVEFHATVQDIREALKPLGLDVTTKDAVDWGIDYPRAAINVTKICALQQEADELQDQLGERTDALEGTFPQAPGRKAAE